MDDDRKRLIEKLKKLFALGKSDNQHEAELAMKKASDLMEEYQISASEIDLQEAGRITREDICVSKGYGVRHWVFALARASARLFDGDCAYSGNQTHVHFIGTATDIEAMKMTFEHLYKSWESIVDSDLMKAKLECEKYSRFTPADTMKFKHGHGVGYADALDTRIYLLVQQRKKNVKAVSVTGNNLVVVKNAAIENYKSTRGYVKHHTSARSGSDEGREMGRMAGNAVPLGGIEGRKERVKK